jgi:hypothetical protein
MLKEYYHYIFNEAPLNLDNPYDAYDWYRGGLEWALRPGGEPFKMSFISKFRSW